MSGCGDDDDSSNTKPSSGDKQHKHDDAGLGHTDGAAEDASSECGGGCAGFGHPTKPAGREALTNVGITEPIDYSDPVYWVCHPDLKENECLRNIDATEIAPDGSQKLVKFERTEDPKFDCFYVYPTVQLDGSANMTDFSQAGVDLVLDPLLSQAAPFTKMCQVYAPLYRQNGLSPSGGGVAPAAGGNPTIGLQDVRDAFKYYVEHLNKGRKFVLLGHSQGSFTLGQLMQMDIDDKPELRAQMISALLLGGNVTVPEGKLVGGSFKNIPLCSKPGETGCVIAYASFDKDAPPPASSAFGRAASGMVAACTAPGPLAGNSGKYKGSYFPTHSNNPSFIADAPIPDGVTTTFVLYRDEFSGKCVNEGGFSYHQVTLDPPDGDKRGMPPYRSTILESIGFGLHLVDYNIPLDDLLDAVAMQADKALK
jgi:DUF3089 family protein